MNTANPTSPRKWTQTSTRKAFAIHLTLSLLIFSSLVFVMLMWWFPGELFMLDGGWQGLKIIALIDLILGPMLTLILWKPGKSSLVFDMSCVATFQICALAYGFYATHQQRTVAVVFADRNFTTLSADSAAIAAHELVDLDLQPKSIQSIDKAHPAMLLTPEPAPGKFGEYVSHLLNGYPESHERLDLFVKRGPEHAALLERLAATQEKLETTGADKFVAKAIEKGHFDADDIEVHYFKARYAKGLVLFSKSEQRILDYIPIKWDELIAKKTAELAAKTSKLTEDSEDTEATAATTVTEATETTATAKAAEVTATETAAEVTATETAKTTKATTEAAVTTDAKAAADTTLSNGKLNTGETAETTESAKATRSVKPTEPGLEAVAESVEQ